MNVNPVEFHYTSNSIAFILLHIVMRKRQHPLRGAEPGKAPETSLESRSRNKKQQSSI
jgi:hypothetical protein